MSDDTTIIKIELFNNMHTLIEESRTRGAASINA